MKLTDLNDLYDYKYDPKGRDQWRVIRPDEQGIYRGDCEDYSLSVLYYVLAEESWLKFLWLLVTRQAKICLVVTKNGEGHAVLRFGDQYIDNWTKQWVPLEGMQELGHEFNSWLFIPYQVAIKMTWAKLRGKV